MATPTDDLCFFAEPPFFIPDHDEIHVSVTFSWDIPRAKYLAYQWGEIGKVSIGGPALNTVGGEFTQGRYLKNGYIITSRGCPNKCWFCNVWKREGGIKELEIKNGWNVLDDNLLACSPLHIQNVFAMLGEQKERPTFTGGLEAKLLTQQISDRLYLLKPKRIYFAYDTDDDKEPLCCATKTLALSGFKFHPSSHVVSCYCLIGHPKDTFSMAESRLQFVSSLGIMPYAMLYRDGKGLANPTWRKFQREWCRPQIVATKMNQQTV
jgi:hypothetical protein